MYQIKAEANIKNYCYNLRELKHYFLAPAKIQKWEELRFFWMVPVHHDAENPKSLCVAEQVRHIQLLDIYQAGERESWLPQAHRSDKGGWMLLKFLIIHDRKHNSQSRHYR